MAGLARGPSQAVPAFVRGALDVPGYAVAGLGCGAVRASDRHHQQRLSLHGAGATGGDRPRGRRAAGADAARLRSGDRGRCGVCASARQRCDRAGAGRRSRGSRHRCVRRRLPRRARRGGSRAHRDLRRAARTRRHRIWLYQSRRSHFRRGPRALRSSSRSRIRRPRRGYIKAGYLWNSGNFMFRAAVLLDEYRNVDAASVQAVTDAVDQGRPRSRIRQARRGRVRIGEGDLDRLCGDGKDRARRRGAGCVRLVRRRLLACGVGIVRQGRSGQRGAGRRRVRGFPQLQRLDRPRAGRARRRRRSRGGRDPGRRAGVAAKGRQRAEAAGREAEDRGAAR